MHVMAIGGRATGHVVPEWFDTACNMRTAWRQAPVGGRTTFVTCAIEPTAYADVPRGARASCGAPDRAPSSSTLHMHRQSTVSHCSSHSRLRPNTSVYCTFTLVCINTGILSASFFNTYLRP